MRILSSWVSSYTGLICTVCYENQSILSAYSSQKFTKQKWPSVSFLLSNIYALYLIKTQSNLNIMNSTGPRNMGYDVLLTSHISMVIVILSDALVAGTYVWLYWQMFTYIRFRHKQCTWDLSTFGGPVAKDWDLIPRLKSESIVSSPSPFKPASSSSCQNQPNQSHTTITIKQYTPIINKVTHNHTFEKFLKVQCIEMMYKSK